MENEYLLQVALELKDQMSKNLEQVNGELNNFKKELKNAGVDVDNLGGRVQKNTTNMKGVLASLSKAAKYTTVALAGVGVATIKSFADTEYSVKKVQTISNKSFDDIKTGAYDLAKKYGGNVGDILEANYQLVSSMGDIAESQQVMETASKLSLAGFTSLEGGMNALTSVMNAYKMEIKDVGMVADTLMSIQNNGITDIQQLQASLYNVLPTAASLKISFLDIAAAMATMTNNKVPTAQATTQIRQALVELAQSGSKADKVFRQIAGESFQEFIASGGNMAEAFELIANSAKKSGMSLYDVFGSTEAVGAVINVTGENMEKFKRNQDAMTKSSGTLDKATSTMSTSLIKEYEKIKGVLKEASDTIGEQLVPYAQDLKKALEEVDFKELLSKENIDTAIDFGKGLVTVSTAVWGISTAIGAVETTLKGATLLKAFMSFVKMGGGAIMANPLAGAAVLGTGAGLTLGTQLGNMHNAENKLLSDSFSKWDGTNSLLNYGDTSWIEKTNKEDYFGGPKSLEEMVENAKKLKEETKEIKDVAGKDTGGKDTGGKDILTDDEIKRLKNVEELLKEFQNLNSNINNKAIAFDMTELEKAEEKLRELESILGKGLELGLDSKSLSSIKEEYKATKDYVDNLKDQANFKEIKENFEKEFANMNLEFEIFGTKEEERLLQTIRTLESQVSKAISEGMIGNAREFGEELKRVKEQYKEKYELPKKASKDFDDNLKNLGDSIYNVAAIVDNDFASTLSTLMNGLASFSSALKMMGVENGLSGLMKNGMDMLGGMGGIGSSLSAGLAAAGPYIAAAAAAVTIGSSLLGKSDEKRKKKNAENEKKFEENTNALKELGEQLKANTATLQDFANTLIASIATSPTLHRIAGGQNALQIMEDVMMENKDFGQLSFLVKESKKNWRGKRKSYSKNREMSESELLGLMGYDTSIGIDEFDLDQLKQFAKDLDGVTESIIRGWADSLTSRKIESIDMSGLEQYKKNVDEFIKQIEMLQKEQKELFRNATLEGFEGINVLDEKQLTEQYKQMFTDMGIDADKYSEAIKEMVEANQVLVTSMEDVRNSFIDSLINGKGDFAGSLGSYFQKIIKNAAMTVYDTLYSEVDNSMNEMFKKMADKLVDMKESGNVDFTGFWKDFDFSEILKAQEIESNFQLVIDDLRKYLLAIGIGEDIIDSFLPISEAQKKINEIKDIINNGLSSAMSQALTDKDFGSFEKSLGQSIYNSVKDSLIKAFIESETYKQYIDKYFNFEEFEKELSGVTDPNKAFEMMQDYLNKLNGKLEANGMGFDDSISGNKEEDNKLGNSYYSDGPSQINITITQSFTGVYGEETMYKIAKQGTKEALEEAKNQSKVVGGVM
ncbi:phage tail tape measure protein [uncultured Clostridium sp.]|uniref:phage tail tape measure protein n=1 Tax=uncultured Clostridium sp. TaxID=59620 RepID=UPI002629393C|nr:phage tail tape measure protein [uncultured Clostridium sp.]